MHAVRELRRRKGWSQQELADASGVGQDTISSLELGRHEPRPSTLRKIAGALGVEVADLFGGADTPKAVAPPSREWALAASDKEFDNWVKTAKAGDLHKLWNELSEHAKGIGDAELKVHVLNRTQKAIDQFFRLMPIEEFIDRRPSAPAENEGREAG